MTKIGNLAAQQATLVGTVANWSAVTVPTGHVKAAVVSYSQTDAFGDPANNLATPSSGNVCIGNPATCSFSIVTCTGALTFTAAIVDLDPHGNADASDGTSTVIGWAMSPGIQVDVGIDQTGLMLTQLAATQLQTVTIDYATPPSTLTKRDAIVGIEISKDEVVQLPVLPSGATSALMPRPTAFATDATYRLTARPDERRRDRRSKRDHRARPDRHDAGGGPMARGADWARRDADLGERRRGG